MSSNTRLKRPGLFILFSFLLGAVAYLANGQLPVSAGESRTVRISMQVTRNAGFGFYAIATSIFGDPDNEQLLTTTYSATQDILDTFENDNFTRVLFGVAPSNGNQPGGNLSATGQNTAVLVVTGALLLVSAGTYLAYKKSPRTK